MLLSKRKLQFIKEMFVMPYRPNLSNYQSEKFDMSKFNTKSTNHAPSYSYNKKSSFNEKSLEITKSQKSSFPSYDYSDINSNINYSIDDLNYTLNYPLRNEIIIGAAIGIVVMAAGIILIKKKVLK